MSTGLALQEAFTREDAPSVPFPREEEEWIFLDEPDLVEEDSAGEGGTVEVAVRPKAASLLRSILDNAIQRDLIDWGEREEIEGLVVPTTDDDRELARQRILKWEEETSTLGSTSGAAESPTYQLLLDMPKDMVITAALERLQDAASPHVLWLLHDLAGAAPAGTDDTVAGAARAWREWGQLQGMVDPGS